MAVSNAVSVPTTADLEGLRQQYEEALARAGAAQSGEAAAPPSTEVADIQGEKRTLLQRFEGMVRRNPKSAVAAAAASGFVAGKMLSKNEQASSLPQHILAKVLGAASGGAVSLLAIHAALAHLPAVVPEVASALAQAPENVAIGLACLATALGITVGHRIAKGLAEKGDPSAPKTSMAETLRKAAIAYSGPVLGTLIGAGLAFVGATAGVPMVLTAAVGAFAGTVLGPVANQDGVSKPWTWVAAAAPVTAGIIGATHGGQAAPLEVFAGLVGSVIGGVLAAYHQGIIRD